VVSFIPEIAPDANSRKASRPTRPHHHARWTGKMTCAAGSRRSRNKRFDLAAQKPTYCVALELPGRTRPGRTSAQVTDMIIACRHRHELLCKASGRVASPARLCHAHAWVTYCTPRRRATAVLAAKETQRPGGGDIDRQLELVDSPPAGRRASHLENAADIDAD